MNQNSRVTAREQSDIAESPATLVNKFYISTCAGGKIFKLTFAEVSDGNQTVIRSSVCMTIEDLANIRDTMNIILNKDKNEEVKPAEETDAAAKEFFQQMKNENSK